MSLRSDLLGDTANRAQHYVESIGDRAVAPTPEALAALDGFDEPMPEDGLDGTDTIEMLDRLGSPATFASTGGRYFGFVNGATLPVALGVFTHFTHRDGVTGPTHKPPHVSSSVRGRESKQSAQKL